MAASAQFAATVRAGLVAISTANTALDGTGTVGTVLTAGASGTRIDRISIKAKNTTSAGMIRLFLHDGSAYHLWREVSVAAITPSATVAAYEASMSSNNAMDIGYLPLTIPTGYSLRASTEKAEPFEIAAFGGDF